MCLFSLINHVNNFLTVPKSLKNQNLVQQFKRINHAVVKHTNFRYKGKSKKAFVSILQEEWGLKILVLTLGEGVQNYFLQIDCGNT